MKRKTVSEAYGIKKSSKGAIDAYMTSNEIIEPVWISVGDDETWQLYTRGEWLFSVINRIIDDCVQTPFEIVPKDKEAKIEGRIKNRIDFCKKFFDDPNTNKESFLEIREKFLRDTLVYGRGALEKVKDSAGALREVYSLLSKNIKVRMDKHGNLFKRRTYKLVTSGGNQGNRLGNNAVYFDLDEVVFMVFLPCSKSVYGIKPIDIVANSVASDILRSTYNSNFLVNGAEASGILSLPGMNRTELKKFRQYWDGRMKGAKNAHRVFITNSQDLKYEKTSMSSKDMEFIEYGREIRNKIFAVYSMQPFVMGIVDETTGKLNSSEQVHIYKQGALKPILNKESYYYTKEIIEDGFGFDDIKLTFPSIDQEDAKTDAEIDQIDIVNGVITINERRRKIGFPPVQWGDTPVSILPGGGQVNPLGNMTPPRNQQGSGNPKPEKKPEKKPTKTSKQWFDELLVLYKEAYTADSESIDEKFNTKVLLKFLNEEETTLFVEYTLEIKFFAKHYEGEPKEFRSWIDKIGNKYQHSEEYKKLFL